MASLWIFDIALYSCFRLCHIIENKQTHLWLPKVEMVVDEHSDAESGRKSAIQEGPHRFLILKHRNKMIETSKFDFMDGERLIFHIEISSHPTKEQELKKNELFSKRWKCPCDNSTKKAKKSIPTRFSPPPKKKKMPCIYFPPRCIFIQVSY